MRVIGLLLAIYALTVLGLATVSARGVLFWGVAGVVAIALTGGAQLAAWRRKGFALAFAGAGGLFAVGMAFLGLRIAFMIEYGGMEGPRGQGSPMVFLIGMAFEQLLFTLPAGGLLLALRREFRMTTGVA